MSSGTPSESSVEEALSQLRQVCDDFGQPLYDALMDKAEELRVRSFLRCMPNDRVKTRDIGSFLREVGGGRIPSAEFIKSLVEGRRGPRLQEDELVLIEERQNGRCGLCGVFLSRSVTPQVDHIIPISLGGKNDTDNYQLLCHRCNLGKSDSLSWIMGAPFFVERDCLTARLRYCVLAYRLGICQFSECGAAARVTEIEVVPVIPIARGGRWIFDNLTTMCSMHARERASALKQQALLKVRQARYANLAAWKLGSVRTGTI